METELKNKKKKTIKTVLLLVILIVIGYIGIIKYFYNISHEITDNAQIEANIIPIIPRVSGYVDSLNIEDNLVVKKGDLLIKLDDKNFALAVKNAKNSLLNAQANYEIQQALLKPLQANIVTNQSQIKNAEVRIWKADKDFKRIKKLFEANAATQQQFDTAKAEYDASLTSLEVFKGQLETSKMQFNGEKTKLKSFEVTIQQKNIDLETANLNLSYSKIISPVDGTISKRNIQLGQYVQAGNPMFAITINKSLWVIANFKETQTSLIQDGMPVKIKLDAYPDVEFDGNVETVSSATGSRFSLLPPDNASGNFVKIVQRIPIKILFSAYNQSKYKLLAGMSCEVSVEIK